MRRTHSTSHELDSANLEYRSTYADLLVAQENVTALDDRLHTHAMLHPNLDNWSQHLTHPGSVDYAPNPKPWPMSSTLPNGIGARRTPLIPPPTANGRNIAAT